MVMAKSQRIFVSKGEYFIHDGEVADRFFYRKGLCEVLLLNGNGQDVTHDFTFRPAFFTSFQSFTPQDPTDFFVKAMDDVEAY